jgi:hypothetical protein
MTGVTPASGAGSRSAEMRRAGRMIRATVWHAAREMPRTPRDRTPKNVSEQSEQLGADDGNRTRMASLEVGESVRIMHADQWCDLPASAREIPRFTRANGTLMARRQRQRAAVTRGGPAHLDLVLQPPLVPIPSLLRDTGTEN